MRECSFGKVDMRVRCYIMTRVLYGLGKWGRYIRWFNRWKRGTSWKRRNERGDWRKNSGIVPRLITRAFANGGHGVERDTKWLQFIPMCMDGHWGVVLIARDGTGRSMVDWRDSFHLTPPTCLLSITKDLYEEVFDRWTFSVD